MNPMEKSATIQKRLESLGLRFPEILLPRTELDLERWAVIACDQFTSDRDYWDEVERFVGDSPSTLRLVLPEAYLEERNQEEESRRVSSTMRRYLEEGVFRRIDRSAVYVQRTLANGTVRQGIVLAVDLESYDYHPETAALIRASEETIPDRLPPRAVIREGAPLETPHVLVLYNDPDETVIAGVKAAADTLETLYDTPLMMGGGSISGRRLPMDHPATEQFITALETVRRGNLLFATGDGNHSLAAARTVWEQRKAAGAASDDPMRYCLVELVNVYDPGLPFHPIHRVAQAETQPLLRKLEAAGGTRFTECTRQELPRRLKEHPLGPREIAFYGSESAGIITVTDDATLPVDLADTALAAVGARWIDYVHGLAEVLETADRIGGIALILPEFDRDFLFPTVAEQGTLPRKAFSLGEARDKRYYLECRHLV